MSDTAYNKTKLEHLTDYIVSHLNSSVLDNKIDAWQERAAIVVDGEDRGNGGHIAAYWRYEAIISIEEFPHRLLDPRNVFALLACWLADHDRERDIHELDDPEITVDVINEESADVLIEIEMMEPIEMIPDEQGLITWRNQRYRVQAVPIDVAEEYELSNEN
ncbi:phage tail protein [Vibrio diabolicus]|uniref:phage tail protein n=1 Tax=Vibrio diabolicus TaxID=50719 RepID=UPI00211B19BC|nr:phage tail protein [Vibrio diabolicus]MCG9228062.1 phage tail protein [Vibrio diabolicus]MCG9569924.1 phage tail protein [Vibrio diabolicus]MCG9592029.1 phage tail protein [Vibrio diabolicus]MCG9772728.1 phage tail protein [Vibrio diabolicus]